MAEVSRMSGALLVQSSGDYYLVGDLKEPCDFEQNGFQDPGERDIMEVPYVRLNVSGSPVLTEPVLKLKIEGEDLCRKLSERLLIKRNGSVSGRLWNLILGSKENSGCSEIQADWLVDMPDEVWEAVRDSVLRCV